MKNKMKKFYGVFAAAILALSILSCGGVYAPPSNSQGGNSTTDKTEQNETPDSGNTGNGSSTESDNKEQTENQNTEKSEEKIIEAEQSIDGATLKDSDFAYITYSLAEYKNKTVTIEFSADMKVINSGAEKVNLMWQTTTTNYPVIISKEFAAGESEWTTVKTSKPSSEIELGDSSVLYLSTYGTKPADLKIYLKNVKYTINVKTVQQTEQTVAGDWKKAESLKEAYKNIFDSFGIACEWKPWNRDFGELESAAVRAGLSHHADSITMGNEFKPDSIFSMPWGSTKASVQSQKFTASNGKVIDVPVLNGFTKMDQILAACKSSGLKMRGHVLVWHSQTPEAFFRENYSNSGKLVDKDTMTARQEWYIKTVLEHVDAWETANNDGKHIVWAWDIVNEAMADDAGKTYTGSSQNWLRGSTSGTKNKAPSDGGSRWYQIYGSEEFIMNAFRFANAYAPADVKLCYNDYNEYMDYAGTNGSWKTSAILHMLELIKNDAGVTLDGKLFKARVDVMGMQSHVGTSWPGSSGYENALKRYLAAGVDVHVTEFDISAKNQNEAATSYKDYFTMLKKYGKKYDGANKITNVTVWGISSQDSWISNNGTQYPLLFDRKGTDYVTNSSYDAVIKAAK